MGLTPGPAQLGAFYSHSLNPAFTGRAERAGKEKQRPSFGFPVGNGTSTTTRQGAGRGGSCPGFNRAEAPQLRQHQVGAGLMGSEPVPDGAGTGGDARPSPESWTRESAAGAGANPGGSRCPSAPAQGGATQEGGNKDLEPFKRHRLLWLRSSAPGPVPVGKGRGDGDHHGIRLLSLPSGALGSWGRAWSPWGANQQPLPFPSSAQGLGPAPQAPNPL